MTATQITEEQLWELVESIWSTMLNLVVKRESSDTIAPGSRKITASVQISGAFQGTVRFMPNEQFARRATSVMLAAPEISLTTADVDDAIGELCNMLAGGVKNLVPSPSSLSLSNVQRGSQSAFDDLTLQVIAGLRFTCEGQPLEVRVLAERKADLETTSFSPTIFKGGPTAMRVLLADDSGTMRTIIRRSLKTLGVFDPVEAVDGAQAIELFMRGGFDLVLTDWNMPGMTGLELVREIRALDKKVPIIMITTESERRRVVDAIQAGVSDYLVKPFTTDTLQEKLERFTQLRSIG